MKEHLIQINAAKCVGCGLCRLDCPESNLSLVNGKAAVLAQNCIKCGHCVAVCPRAAVSMTGFDEPPMEMEAPTVLDPRRLLAAIQTRRTIRRFTDQAVPPEVLAQVIEAGRFTPTAKNAQDVHYLVLRDRLDDCEAIAVRFFRRLLPLVKLVNPSVENAEIDDHFFFKKAPAAILVLSKNTVNGALATSNMELMAQANGLGVLYSGFFAMAANRSHSLRKALSLKRGERVVTTLVLGYPGINYRRTAQKEAAFVRFL